VDRIRTLGVPGGPEETWKRELEGCLEVLRPDPDADAGGVARPETFLEAPGRVQEKEPI